MPKMRPARTLYKRPDLKHLTRAIPHDVKLHLAIATAGRCQFRGCNDFLFRHPVTGLSGNFAQYAHIVAFSNDGPRGQGMRPRNIHEPENLTLLCAKCHKLVDDKPHLFPVETLREYKRQHERRVQVLTAATPDNLTVVLKLAAKIRGQETVIPTANIETALFPRFTQRERDCAINLTDLEDAAAGYYAQATKRISDQTSTLYRPGLDGRMIEHLSVFALGPIPMLVFLGSQLSTKIRTEIYQRHRSSEGWEWMAENRATTLRYSVNRLRRGNNPKKVALIVSLSGKVLTSELPATISREYSVYEIAVRGRAPSVTLLKRKADLEGFKEAYQGCLGTMLRDHGKLKIIDLFAAVPAPVAVLCGRERLPKVHPRLRVYENDSSRGGFYPALEVE